LLLTTLALRPGMSTVYDLTDSPEPLVAVLANLVASHFLESDLDPYAAIEAARRMEDRLDENSSPWLRVVAQMRIAELGLQVGEPEEARRLMGATLGMLEPDVIGLRLALVMANLHAGDLEAAEQWLEQVEGQSAYQLGVRAEIQLARGEIETGLRSWRRALACLNPQQGTEYRVEPFGLDPLLCEIQAVTVIAHAQHDRLELVADLVAQLPARLIRLLEHPTANPSPFLMETPVWGALLLAAGMADRPRSVRLIALAERFRYVRNFQPTMSPQRVRQIAEQTDRPAYAEAVSEYAGLNRDELRRAALSELADRADR
jgi:predicted negative regulator of RcsB-dependent stress response